MFTMTDCERFKKKFRSITNQKVEDWTSYEQLELDGKQCEPCAVGQAIDLAIVGEINRTVDSKFYQASYLRDLAALLVELREAML